MLIIKKTVFVLGSKSFQTCGRHASYRHVDTHKETVCDAMVRGLRLTAKLPREYSAKVAVLQRLSSARKVKLTTLYVAEARLIALHETMPTNQGVLRITFHLYIAFQCSREEVVQDFVKEACIACNGLVCVHSSGYCNRMNALLAYKQVREDIMITISFASARIYNCYLLMRRTTKRSWIIVSLVKEIVIMFLELLVF